MKEKLSYEQFLEAEQNERHDLIEKRIGTIEDINFLPKNKKMVMMRVKFDDTDIRNVVSNIGGRLADISVLRDKKFQFITNLEPAIVSKHESQAMIVVEEKDGQVIIPE